MEVGTVILSELHHEHRERVASCPVLTYDGDYYPRVGFDDLNAHVVAYYWGVVSKARKGGSDAVLRSMSRVEIRDIDGNRYRLLTDINAINEFFREMAEEEGIEQFRRVY